MLNIFKYISSEKMATKEALTSQKRVFEMLSTLLHPKDDETTESQLFSLLMQREKLGSTAIGKGVALPHARLSGLSNPAICVLTLEKSIEFEAPDGHPVDIFVGLLVPEEKAETHLNILSDLASLLRQDTLREAIREAKSGEEVYKTFLMARVTHE